MRKSVLFLILGFLTIPAFGDVVDVDTLLHDKYLDNWTIVADNSSTWTGSFGMSVHSSVYENTAGDYTFVFDVVPTVDGVFALNLGGDFSSAQQAEGLHSPGGAGTLFFNVDFEGDMSVVILPSVDTGEHFIFSFLVLSSANTSWELYYGNALGGAGGYTSGWAYAPGEVLVGIGTTAVPEPSTLLLLGFGLVVGTAFRKRFN